MDEAEAQGIMDAEPFIYAVLFFEDWE